MKNLFYFLLAAILPLGSFAQTNPCGFSATELSAQQQRLQNNLANAPTAGLRAVQYVPVRVHLVADSDGAGRVYKRRILDLMCQINEDFAAGDIQFYLHEDGAGNLFGETIANNLVYEDSDNNTAIFLMEAARDTAAINIYIVGEIDLQGSFGYQTSYYSYTHNWIVLTKLATIDPFASHQLGHYFSLLHTFHGWMVPFEPSSPGWPVAPAMIGGNLVELMDGSNCLDAGDQICDTPPDYIFGTATADCAPYTGGALDPTGQLVDPMEDNMMGYFSGCDPYLFTPGQFAAMNAELASPEQDYLDNNFAPLATDIITPPDLLVYPPPSFILPSNTNILLDWLDVAGATHYLVELDITAAFTTPLRQEIVATESQFNISQPLLPNQKYYWRVRPFNAYVACATFLFEGFSASVIGQFTTGPATSAVSKLTSGAQVSIAPNPVQPGGQITINLELPRPLEAQITAIDATGRQVIDECRALPAGATAWPLTTENWPSGIIFLKINLGDQCIVEKIVRQ